PGAKCSRAAGVLKSGQVFDDTEQDLLAQVVDVARGHALALEPADDEGTIQVGQVLPGILLAGLNAEQQAFPSVFRHPSPSTLHLFPRIAVSFPNPRRFFY